IAQINNELRHAEVNYTLAVEGEKRVRERLAKVDAMEVTVTEVDTLLDRDPQFKDLTLHAEKAEQFATSMRNVYADASHPNVRDSATKLQQAKAAIEDYKKKRKTELTRELQ